MTESIERRAIRAAIYIVFKYDYLSIKQGAHGR